MHIAYVYLEFQLFVCNSHIAYESLKESLIRAYLLLCFYETESDCLVGACAWHYSASTRSRIAPAPARPASHASLPDGH